MGWIIGLVVVGILALLYSCLRVASDADDEIERRTRDGELNRLGKNEESCSLQKVDG
jgi:hypothetical protein